MSYDSKLKRDDIDELFEAILTLRDVEDCYRFFEDICTINEIHSISQRLVEIISRPVATVENGLVRHNPGHLAWELVQLHNQRNIRLVCRDSHRTTCNRVET